MFRHKNKNKREGGFTLIELLVVIAIIGLLSSVALIAFVSARQKARDVKRLSDMTQMNTALELYYAANRGYPTTVDALFPTFLSNIPNAPLPADGNCDSLTDPSPVPGGIAANSYYYFPSPTGGSYVLDGLNMYPDYAYYFCLGNTTGNFPPGARILTPKGVR